jgi:hypothetical protein
MSASTLLGLIPLHSRQLLFLRLLRSHLPLVLLHDIREPSYVVLSYYCDQPSRRAF